MTDRPSLTDRGEHGARPPRAPRWVRVFWGVVAIAIIVVLFVHAAGGGLGGHG